MKTRIFAAIRAFLNPEPEHERHEPVSSDCSTHMCDYCSAEVDIAGQSFHFEDIHDIEDEWVERGIIV